MAFDYVWEKFHVAVGTLAAGTGSIQERLADAFVGALIRLDEKDFPTPKSRQRFTELMKVATSAKPQGGEGSVVASFRAMSDEQCSDIADEIVQFYDEIAQEQGFRTGEPALE